MVQKIKKSIQKRINNICYKKYLQEIDRQDDSYKQWYCCNEGWKRENIPALQDEAVIFADRDGIVEEKAAGLVEKLFREHPYVQLAYADEDCLDENGKRCDPWFKPQWSPDTLDSFQYFGHFFAVRRSLLEKIDPCVWESCLTDCSSEKCYQLLLKLTRQITENKWIKANDTKKAIVGIGQVLIHMQKKKPDAEAGEGFCLDEKQTASAKAKCDAVRNISVIIPSKDNSAVLRICISTLKEKTQSEHASIGRLALEIIVVDNGSSPENKLLLEEMAEQYGFTYLYEPMPFNFSKMCNLGVEKSHGEYLLLLNDDMEIIQPDWLLRLYEKASLPHAGAVGAKLLYPESDVIQHIGITNAYVGPIHKLLKLHDEKVYYHGQNRHIYDMIGVTAACLMVSREKFYEAGGLYEGMAVAYNDVDFCFALYELGYYNILRNDVVLYHHESLSRGDDTLSDEKWLRLLQEKDILYDRHPSLKHFDPFHSPNLAGNSNLYLPNYIYAFEKRDCGIQVKKWRGAEPVKWENECLIVNVEHAKEEKKLELKDQNDVYWIEGWSYILGLDNCRYKRSLLLISEQGRIYEAELLNRYRKDVAAVLPQQINVGMAGFTCRFPKGTIPAGTYTIALLAKDCCSGQRLYRRTEKKMVICGSSVNQ